MSDLILNECILGLSIRHLFLRMEIVDNLTKLKLQDVIVIFQFLILPIFLMNSMIELINLAI